jgi:hypothetical protein
MRVSALFPIHLIVVSLALAISVQAQKEFARSARIMYAKTVFFSNQTNSSAVGANALAQLKKWGKYQMVHDRQHADLIFLLSLDPYRDKSDPAASGQSGGLDDGDITADRTPKWNQQKPTRYAYLTVIDARTGDSLWSAEHIWGGLLTGFNSVGERLVKELENQTKP